MENEGASQSNAGIFFLPVSYTAERSRSKKSNQTSCVVARQIFTRINIPIRAIKRVEPARKSLNRQILVRFACVFEFYAEIRTPN